MRSGSLRRMSTIAVAGPAVPLGRLRCEGGSALADSEKAQDRARQVEVGSGVALQHNAAGKAIPDSIVTIWSTERP